MTHIAYAYNSCPKDPTIYSFLKFFDIAPENYGWVEANHYDLLSGDYFAIPAVERFLEIFENTRKVRFLVYVDVLKHLDHVSSKVFATALEGVWTSLGLSLWRPKPGYLQAEGYFKSVTFEDIYHCEKNKAFFDSLPENITVYRGTTIISQKKAQNGMSWTTDYNEACLFALKDGLKAPNRICLKGTIPKTKILAAYNKRQEIVIPSGGISQIIKEPIFLTERAAAFLDEQEDIAA